MRTAILALLMMMCAAQTAFGANNSVADRGTTGTIAADTKDIKLNPPDKKRGLPFMETLSVRASVREFSDKELSLQDLSDLAWAANGINRPESGKITAPSAMNRQDVVVYYFLKSGAYVYEPKGHVLRHLVDGDFRAQVVRGRPSAPNRPVSVPPVLMILVSDGKKFGNGSPEMKREWGAIDAGIVSQNIALFCAATGLKTVPRASTDRAKVKEILKLDDEQYIVLNHPVGHAKE
ncbi:SagB/ThcOx family dehydrogenase [bacterium]|nr:SagB/ThcOx family dehydrogenase [bacterium]